MTQAYYDHYFSADALTRYAGFYLSSIDNEKRQLSFTIRLSLLVREGERLSTVLQRIRVFWQHHPPTSESLNDVTVRASLKDGCVRFILPASDLEEGLNLAVGVILEYRKSAEIDEIKAALQASWNAFSADALNTNAADTMPEDPQTEMKGHVIDEISRQLYNLFTGDECEDYRRYFSSQSIAHPSTTFAMDLVQKKMLFNVYLPNMAPADREVLFEKISFHWQAIKMLLSANDIYYLNSIDLENSEQEGVIQFVLPVYANKQVLALLNIAIFALYKANASKSMVPYQQADLVDLNAALIACWNRSLPAFYQIDTRPFNLVTSTTTTTYTSVYAEPSSPAMFPASPEMLSSAFPPIDQDVLLKPGMFNN